MNKIVEYINSHSVEEIVEAIQQKDDLDLATVAKQLIDSRTEYGLKVQKIIETLLKKG